jgi:Protein of unknown function (DUF4199)
MKPPYKYALLTAFTVGIFTICFFSIVNWLDTTYNWGIKPANIRGISGLLTILIQAIGIYFSMTTVKINQNGLLSYSQAAKAGITVAIITALITAIFGFIYCEFINPGYAKYMVNEARKTMLTNGESQHQIADHLVSVRKEFSTTAQMMMALIGQSVIGTMLSLIIAPFIKSKNAKT